MIGWNTIISSIGLAVQVDNAKATEVVTITWQDEVTSMLREAEIDEDFASELIQCESSWNPDAFHQNKGSIDRGLWQINSVYHSEVSMDCSYDPICATREAIRIIKTRGFSEWVCNDKIR